MNSRFRRSTLVVLAITLVVVAVASVLLRFQGGEGSAAAGTQEQSVDSEPVVEGLPLAPMDGQRYLASRGAALETQRKVSSNEIRVQSSAGIPLTSGERLSDDGTWVPLPCVEEALRLDARYLPTEVRAAGHIAARVSSLASPFLLQPDMLVEVTGDDLQDAAMAVEVGTNISSAMVRNRLLGFCSMGFVDSNKYGLAVEADEWKQGTVSDIDVTLTLASGHVVHIDCRPVSGLRASYSIDTAGSLPVSNIEKLQLHIDGLSTARPTSLEVRVVAWPDIAVQSDGSIEMSREVTSWGRVATLALRYSELLTVEEEQEILTLRRLAIGTPVLVTVRDRVSGDYGRVKFQHDGRPFPLAVLPGASLCGVVLSTNGLSPPQHVNLIWQFDVHDTEEWRSDLPLSLLWWGGEARDLFVGETGTFSVTVPTTVPAKEGLYWPMPTLMRVRVDAHGFEPRVLVVPMDVGRKFDCGQIMVTPVPPDIELAPGHGLLAESLDDQGLVVLRSGHLRFQLYRAFQRSDGTLNLYLARPYDATSREIVKAIDVVSAVRQNIPWSLDEVESLVIEYAPEKAVGFTRIGPHFVRAPSQEHSVTLRYKDWPVEGNRLFYGWAWNEIVYSMAPWQPQDDRGRELEVEFQAPSGAVFWVSSAPQGPLAVVAGKYERILHLDSEVITMDL